MKSKFLKRTLSILMAVLTVAGTMFSSATPAFAAEQLDATDVQYPRPHDSHYGDGTFGRSEQNLMSGWYASSNDRFWAHSLDSYTGQVMYCIEPGVERPTGATFTKSGESFWDNYPSDLNETIAPDDIKVLLGRIMQYGYQGNLSLDWDTANDSDADQLANLIATQMLVWETVVGERDALFNHVDTGGRDEVFATAVRSDNPIRDRIVSHYNRIVSSVQSHTVIPSFMARSSGKADTIELEWDGSSYKAVLTDSNDVLGNYSFTSDNSNLSFSTSGNKLTISTTVAPTGAVTISASKNNTRTGVITWTDGVSGGGYQDVVTYGESVSDPVKAFLNVKVSYGGVKIVKTAEDGKVSGITFTVEGNGYKETATTDKNGVISLANLKPGKYTVTEAASDAYEPQDPQTVTVEIGKTAEVSFNNTLKRGDLQIIKSAEDGLVEGIKFRLYGTATHGSKVDETAITDAKGVATFKNIPVGTNYTVEEVDTAAKYIVPESQSAPIKWKEVMKLTFDNELKRGDLEIKKTSEDGLVEGVKFHLYGTAVNGDKVDLYATTDANGIAIFKNVLIGSGYTVEEVDTAARYEVPDAQTTPIEWNKVMHLDFENNLKRGDLEIQKTSEDGFVENMEFHLYGTALNGEKVDVYGKTDSKGVVTFRDILIGDSYTVEEVHTKAWYIVPDAQITPIEWNKVMHLDFRNDLKKGDLKVIKISEDKLVEGVKFHLTGTSDSGAAVDEYAVTDKDGIALFKDILIGSGYVIEEVDTAIRYVVPESQEAAIEWNKVTEKSFTNILKKFNVTLSKTDSETGEPQADAKLSGAKYGLYNAEDLVATYVTDENGQFTTDYFPCGDQWTIREIEPSEGYLLDTNTYPVGAEAKLYTIELNPLTMDVEEDIIKGKIALIKHSDNGETQIETPEAGAKFEIYLKSSGSYEEAVDTERDLLVCDEYGYAESRELPYGTYTVHQVSGWDGRELMADFDVYISKNGETYPFLINNRDFESYIKVVKVDRETGKTIPYAGAGFQIFDPEGNKVTMTYTYPELTVLDTFYTTADGTLITPEKLPYGKNYTLVEVQAPYGYVLDSTPIPFDVEQDKSTKEESITLIVVEKTNMAQKGIISILKTGEVFASVNQTGEIYTPIYEVRGLADAVYEIRAVEDIVTPEGTVRAEAGTVVDTITTDETGIAKSKELYLGKYEIKEISAPYGMVLNDEVKTAELTYAGQEIELTETSVSFCNERQKASISLVKAAEKDETFDIGENGEIAKVQFGLYADKELTAADGSVIPENGLIAAAFCSEDGNATFDCDVPVGADLYVKEIAADEHYIVSDQKFIVAFAYAGQEIAQVDFVVNDGKPIENHLKRGTVRGLKVDEDGKTIEKAVFGLFKVGETEFTGENAILTAETDSEGIFVFEKLPYGEYLIREITPAEGFVLNETVYPVTIQEDGQLVEIGFENLHITGSVQVTKVDEDYPENKLTGAEFEVYLDLDNDGKYDAEKDVLVGQMKEVETGIYQMDGLRYGSYFVYEKTAPDGFKKDDGYYHFEIREDGKIVTVENEAGVGFINQCRTGSIRIEKTSEDGVLKGFTFRVEGKDPAGNAFSKEYVTDEKGQILIEGLRIGDYTVTEVANEATKKYVLPEGKMVTVLEDKTTVAKFHNELKPEKPDIPKTGDESNMGLWIGLMGVSVLGLAAGSVLTFRKKKKED